MKRFFAMLLAAVMVLSLCACGGGEDILENQGDESSTETANLIDYSKIDLKTEEIEPLTAENFETEVDNMMSYLPVEKMGLPRDGVGSLLLYYNMADISQEDIITILEGSWIATQGESGYSLGLTWEHENKITPFYSKVAPDDYLGWAQFSYNAQGRTVLSLFDDLNKTLKTDISKAETDNICEFICNYCNNEVSVLVDGKEVYLTDNNELVQDIISRELLDVVNTIKSENKWYDTLLAAGNDYFSKATNDAWDKYVPEQFN